MSNQLLPLRHSNSRAPTTLLAYCLDDHRQIGLSVKQLCELIEVSNEFVRQHVLCRLPFDRRLKGTLGVGVEAGTIEVEQFASFLGASR